MEEGQLCMEEGTLCMEEGMLRMEEGMLGLEEGTLGLEKETLGQEEEMLGQGGRHHGLRDLTQGHKKKKDCDSHHNLPSRVGITGLEPATSRPPDVCATNCAKSRTCGCKGTYLLRNNQTFTLLFSKIPLFLMFVCCFYSLHGDRGTSGRRRGTLHGCEDNLQRHGDDEGYRPILKISKKMAFILYCLHFALTLCYYIYNKVDAGALVVMLRLAKRTMQYETDIPLHADGSARAHFRRLLE